MTIINKLYTSSCIVTLLSVVSCKKFVEIEAPRTDLIRATVFTGDKTANAAVADIYYQMSRPSSFACGGDQSVSFFGALSSDDAINQLTSDIGYQQLNNNALLPVTPQMLNIWTDLYASIYRANAVVEGLASSAGVTDNVKKQLEGEAKFIRAFCYFYLVNLWGDVPLVLTTNYNVNQNMGRTTQAKIYEQIVMDLKEAQNLLMDDFSFSNNERTRANKGVAIALLARVYLYLGEWDKAEEQATILISNTSKYNLTSLNDVFLKNSNETILQLIPINSAPNDLGVEHSFTNLQPSLINVFEPTDQRKVNWVDGNMANKYKLGSSNNSEYSVIFRLAEQYLIRAEARARQNNISGAQEDINAIRFRAGLPATSANNEDLLLEAIEQERRVELFMEWGHRWLDLKRWNKAGTVLESLKAPNWQSTDVLYPIPEYQILNSPVTQNPGY